MAFSGRFKLEPMRPFCPPGVAGTLYGNSEVKRGHAPEAHVPKKIDRPPYPPYHACGIIFQVKK
jgi:hypothetical protein